MVRRNKSRSNVTSGCRYLPLRPAVALFGALLLLGGCSTSGGTLHYEWAPERQISAASGDRDEHTESAIPNPAPGSANSAGNGDQEAPFLAEDDMSLADLLTYALEHNPSVEAAFERWRAATDRAPQARSLPDPQLTYGYFVLRSAERQGMMERQRISITQMFPWFGTLDSRGSAAEQQAHAVARRLEAEVNRLVAEVRKQYAEYYYVEAALRILEEQREIVNGLNVAIEASYESGLANLADVLRIASDLDRIGDRVQSLEERRRPVVAELNRLLGRPAGAALPAPREWDFRAADDEELLELAAELYRHPELRARESEIRAAEDAVRLARHQGRPDFMVGAEVMERRGEQTEGLLMLGMSLPVWRENYSAARREARAQRREVAAERQALTLDLEARFAGAVFELRDAERQVRLYDESLLPRAEGTFAIVEAAYFEGEASFVDLTAARRELLDIRDARARSLADQAGSYAELYELAGRGAAESPDFFQNERP